MCGRYTCQTTFVFTAVALFVIGCSSTTGVPDREASVTGVVTSVGPSSILIQKNPPQCDGLAFRITDKTRLLTRKADGSVALIPLSEIKVGDRAQGWNVGPIAESCPGQTGAEAILIL